MLDGTDCSIVNVQSYKLLNESSLYHNRDVAAAFISNVMFLAKENIKKLTSEADRLHC